MAMTSFPAMGAEVALLAPAGRAAEAEVAAKVAFVLGRDAGAELLRGKGLAGPGRVGRHLAAGADRLPAWRRLHLATFVVYAAAARRAAASRPLERSAASEV